MPGLELQQTLARNGGARRPIVFLTGRADILSSVRAMKAGAVDVLTKPIDDGILLAAIAQAERLDAELRRERRTIIHRGAPLKPNTPRTRSAGARRGWKEK